MPSLFLFFLPHHCHSLSFIFLTRSPLLSLFLTSSFLLPFIHPSVISSHSFPIYHTSSLPQPLLQPSLSRHSMVNLFIFSLPFPLSLIRPGVFCSIYHLDETLPQFINTLHGLVYTCTRACLLLFLLTWMQ